MKELLLCVRLKNNRLVRLREELGLGVCRFASLCDISPSRYSAIENLHYAPLRHGEWTAVARKIADFHGVEPAWLWPDLARQAEGRALRMELSSAEAEVVLDPARRLDLERLLGVLPPAEVRLLTAQVVEGASCQDAGSSHPGPCGGDSVERTRQRVCRSLRVLRGSKLARGYYGGDR